ncbi:hypothetical protein G6F61_010550 [Rhizopus arrhizus]|nr:hypothetical protein G6F24_011114 [Rhizopus arrhizus]KAG0933494.1 hypothetical protein G6F32_011061 [Rhizopus arrhizus]KAG1373007.1 hypothetical protein G6F61_010550 [Rhizopus arrhizus]
MDGIGTILFDKTDRILIELFGQVGGLYTEEGILKLLESNTVLLAGGESCVHILKEDALRSHHRKSTSESHDADIR